MICPHCLATIDDEATECPHCHRGVESRPHAPRLIFCEGCGARLSPHDRTCPKCGRPAPGILSTVTSASDLAAGKTASFPRLTQKAIDTELPHTEPVTAQSVLDDSFDSSMTSVLDRSQLEERMGPKGGDRGADPYHSKKRSLAAIIGALACVLLAGAAVAFVALDPWGVMPSLYSWVEQSASEMFPSREGMGDDASASDTSSDGGADVDDAADDEPLLSDEAISDDAAYQQLTAAYDQILAINEGDEFADAIDSFNGSYLLSSLDARKEASEGAYALREELQGIIEELDGMKLSEGSAYTEDLEHVRQLAQWMYERVDVICASWDVSLGYPDGERMASHQDEILAPMRTAGNSAMDSFYENVYNWRPVER